MALAEPSKTTVAGAAATSFAPAKPSGTAAGDVLLALFYTEQIGTITPPTGFTSRADITATPSTSIRLVAYTKVADGSEGATLSWTWTGSLWRVGALMRITGADTTQPDVAAATSNNGNANGTNPPTVAVTTATDGALCYLIGGNGNGGTWTVPDGTWTLVYNSGDDAGIARKAISPAGATGSVQMKGMTVSNSVASVLIAIRPAAATTAPVGKLRLYPQAVRRSYSW
jgi:hypothetical protein